jgi:hypothetical protein
MKRNEFDFTIGYSGKNAVVDKKAMNTYGKLSTMELAENGLFRAAFASAIYSGNSEEMQQFIAFYSKCSGRNFQSSEELSRVFGVYPVNDVKATLL